MNSITHREIKVEAVTGEVYYDYTEAPEVNTDTPCGNLATCLGKVFDSHFDRLASLRVYDTKRVMKSTV